MLPIKYSVGETRQLDILSNSIKNARKMIAEIAQVDIKLGDKKENLKKAIEIIKGSHSDLILFPELFTTGIDPENRDALAEAPGGKTEVAISEICGDKIVAGSIIEKEKGRLYNTFLLITREGVIGRYRKIHLFSREKDYFTPGDEIGVFDTRFGKIALATCYDLRFPELFRKFPSRGAGIILLCANFPIPRRDHWETLIRARAIENQCFMLSCNRVGKDTMNEYFGGSMVVDPWGLVLSSGGDGQETIRAEIDVGRVAEIRENFPVLRDIKLI